MQSIDFRDVIAILSSENRVQFLESLQNHVFYIDNNNKLVFISTSTLADLLTPLLNISIDWSELQNIPQYFIFNGASKQYITRHDIEAPPSPADYTYLVYRTTTNSWTYNTLSNIAPSQLQNGTQNYVLTSGISVPVWSLIQENSLSDSCVTTSKINDASITNAKIAPSAVSTSKIGSQQVTADKIANNSITNTQISSSANIAVNKLQTPPASITQTLRSRYVSSSMQAPNFEDASLLYGSAGHQLQLITTNVYTNSLRGANWEDSYISRPGAISPYFSSNVVNASSPNRYSIITASCVSDQFSSLYPLALAYQTAYTSLTFDPSSITQVGYFNNSGAYFATSSRKGKKEISKYTFNKRTREQIKKQLNLSSWRMEKCETKHEHQNRKQIGYVLEEIECVCEEKCQTPGCECCCTCAKACVSSADDVKNGFAGVEYSRLAILQVEELKREISEQEARIERLEKIVYQLATNEQKKK